MTKPLYKWTGGKGRLLKKYTNLGFFPDPSEFDTFVDLFFGAGAVTCWVADMYPDKKLIIIFALCIYLYFHYVMSNSLGASSTEAR